MFIHFTPSDAEHVFTEAAPDWGFNTFMPDTELHNPRNGWISGTGELEVQVRDEEGAIEGGRCGDVGAGKFWVSGCVGKSSAKHEGASGPRAAADQMGLPQPASGRMGLPQVGWPDGPASGRMGLPQVGWACLR